MAGQNSKFSVNSAEEVTYDHHGYKLDDPSLKGFHRYFNNSTIRGRANVAKATMSLIAAYIVGKKIMSFFVPKNNPNDKIETN